MAEIVNHDMELILKGDQKAALRQIVKNRFFALIKLPSKKPDRYISKCSSSVFFARMNSLKNRTCAIRKVGEISVFEECEYYLTVFFTRGKKDYLKDFFDKGVAAIGIPEIEISYPTVEEFLSFMNDMELVFITNYVERNGNVEACKIRHFLNDDLQMRRNFSKEFILYDDYYDIKIYLIREEHEGLPAPSCLSPDDIYYYDIKGRILRILERNSKEFFSDESDYFVEYETRSDVITALYFATRFHSNPLWDVNPVCILNFRISVFVLPGEVSRQKMSQLPDEKKTKHKYTEEEYYIDSIFFTSDMCLDLADFEKLIDGHFYDFTLA